MKSPIDNFSNQSSSYKKFRPEYPQELYLYILSHIKNRGECWDCGTGNGQVAKEMSNHFKKIHATDISQNQLNLATQKPNIKYQIARAEQTEFEGNQFDLITVAQAIHWFDIKAFTTEAKRVGKDGSKICIWGYSLLSIDEATDAIIEEFYYDIIGPYWNKERKHVDRKYESIAFDFAEVEKNNNLSIQAEWSKTDLIGYLNSWSSVQNYIKEKNQNPVEEVERKLTLIWPPGEMKKVKFPIFIKIGTIKK